MSFTRRFIDVTFFGGKYGTITFNSRGKYALRTSARILRAGGYNQSELQLEIRGLSLQHINQLSTYGTVIHPNYNYKIKVDAGDDINGMSTVFVGNIQQAWADMKAMPDCPFHVIATVQGDAATMKADPTSFSGPTEAETMLQQLAGTANLGFRNFGLKAKLADPYFWGSPWKQMKEILDAANGDGIIENGVLNVWPQDGKTDGNLVISPGTGLRDYPSFTQYGVQVRYEFHKNIPYRSTMTIEGSQIEQANGTWTIIRIDYDLQSNTPHGQWFAIIDGWDPKNAASGVGGPPIP
jgi:hypothetical protein